MADIGFGSHESDWHAVANLALAQIGDRRQRIFISGAKAGRALHRANDHRAGVFAEFFPTLAGYPGVIDVANRLCMPARSQSLDFIEGEVRASRDHQIVVRQASNRRSTRLRFPQASRVLRQPT